LLALVAGGSAALRFRAANLAAKVAALALASVASFWGALLCVEDDCSEWSVSIG
jgi:hypothetical protein